MRRCHRSGPVSARSSRTAPSPTSIPRASGGCRSTTRRTCATRSRASARCTSRTRRPATARASRLLRAAKRHGIMPIGFISSQLRQSRKLPTGDVTFLLTDIEGSTELLGALEDEYAELLATIRRLVRAAVEGPGGHEVSARGDDVFAVFEEAGARARGRVRDPARDARREVAGRARRAPADRPPPRAAPAHRRRVRGSLGPRRRADLLRGARRPDDHVGRRPLGAARARPRHQPRLVAVPGACRSRSRSSRSRRPTCPPTSPALRSAIPASSSSRYDDELWELVPERPRAAARSTCASSCGRSAAWAARSTSAAATGG